jgi:TolA-binding protein
MHKVHSLTKNISPIILRSLLTAFRPLSIALCFLLIALCSPLGAQTDKENADFKLAVNLYNDGMYDLALQQFKNFIEAYPNTSNSIEARFFLGLVQMKLKQYDDARMTFQNFALAYVNHQKAPEAWINVAEAYLALGEEREAASAYERIKIFHPKSSLVPVALLKSALLYSRLGEHNNAKRLLRSLLQDYPSNQVVPSARLHLAEVYAEEGQTTLAEQEARRVSESTAPDTLQASALLFLGKLNLSASLFDDAEEKFQTVLTRFPKSYAAQEAGFHRAALLKSSGKYREAAEQYEKVAKTSTRDSLRVHAWLEAGNAYLLGEQFGNARQCFQQVLEARPDARYLENALLGAGTVAVKQKEYSSAVKYFSQIVSSTNSPLRQTAFLRLAEAQIASQRWRDAAATYLEYINTYPDDHSTPLVMFKLGTLYHDHLKDVRKAIAVFDDLVQKFPLSTFADEALREIGKYQEEQGRYNEAVTTYRDILARYPSNPENTAVMNRIEFLQHHHIKDHDRGLEQLARLIGEVVSQKPPGEIAYQLAEIYFNDLKEYAAAAEQYTHAIENGIGEEKFITAYFHRARAYHFLSEREPSAVEQAIQYYTVFLKLYPDNAFSGEAEYHLLRLKKAATTSSLDIDAAQSLLKKNLPPPYRQELLLLVGKTLGDTAGTKYLLQLAREFPASTFAQEALWLAGSWYREQQQPDTAIQLWNTAVEKIPHGFYTSKILMALADVYRQTNQIQQSISAYEKLTTEYSYTNESVPAFDALIDVFIADGQYDRAIELLGQQLKASSDEKKYWSMIKKLADALDKKGNTQQAVKLYTEYLLQNRMNPDASEVFYALGKIARTEGKNAIAASHFKQATQLGASGSALREIADLLFQNEQYAEAAVQYKKLAQSAAAVPDKQYFLSRAIVATLRMDKLMEAQAMITEFQKQFSRLKEAEAEFEFEKGTSYFRNKNYAQAKKVFENLVDDYERTKFEPWGYYYLGKISEVTNKHDEAAKQYLALLEKFQTSDVIPRVLLSLGNMHFNAERYDDAIKYYQQIIDIAEKNGDVLQYAMNNLIEAYESKKLYDAALKLTREYIERYPLDENIIDKKIKIGILYNKLGYHDQAVLHFQNLLPEAGSSLEAELRYNIGESYYDKGNYQEAILEFLKVPYLVTQQGKVNWTATSLYMAGQSYEKMSKFDEALQMYQQIVDRSGIDATFKAAARKEIDRVKTLMKKGSQ